MISMLELEAVPHSEKLRYRNLPFDEVTSYSFSQCSSPFYENAISINDLCYFMRNF
jgi:hypothetical protein